MLYLEVKNDCFQPPHQHLICSLLLMVCSKQRFVTHAMFNHRFSPPQAVVTHVGYLREG